MITDSLYGCFELEPVLTALLNSPPVQRLKRVHQGGANFLVNKRWNNTRYEHSVGVMLLIRKLGGSLPEQVAGLLHDVSHTAFSHVADYVFQNSQEDFHEKCFEQIIHQSDIPAILLKYGFDVEEILSSSWSLLEQPLPHLCADRIDYTLRDLHHIGAITLKEAQSFLQDLKVVDGQIVVQQISAAIWFTTAYFRLIFDYFQHPASLYANNVLSNMLRQAYSAGDITDADFFLDDYALLGKLQACGGARVQQILNQIKQGKHDETVIQYNSKERYIDPAILVNGKVVPASKVSEVVAKEIHKAKMLYSKNLRPQQHFTQK